MRIVEYAYANALAWCCCSASFDSSPCRFACISPSSSSSSPSSSTTALPAPAPFARLPLPLPSKLPSSFPPLLLRFLPPAPTPLIRLGVPASVESTEGEREPRRGGWPSGGKEVWRRPEGPAEDGLRRLEESWVLSDGRLRDMGVFDPVGEAA